ncbi:MAG: hypothetical protein ACR2IF_15905 [Terriglobales bacterium]
MRTCLLAVLLFAVACAAQQPPDFSVPDAQQICAKEFGAAFQLDPKFNAMVGDLDGDGRPDLILVALSKDPLVGEAEFNYRVIDPYDAYFGFGDPKVTLQFSATNIGPSRYVLVIHDWKAPKGKFVIINLPFDVLTVSRVLIKKKTLPSIHSYEAGGLESNVYWDGKKYRWEPGYMGND